MMQFSLSEIVVIAMIIYWPVTLIVAGLVLALGFVWTERPGWRVFWISFAALMCYPVIWDFITNY